jgi:MYXO-CTERM domain-containing protein
MPKMQTSTAAVLAGATLMSATMTTEVQAAADIAYFALNRSRLVSSDGTVMGYAANIRHSQAQGASNLSAIRPNGESGWQYSYPGFGLIQTSGESLMSAAAMDSWSGTNFTGVWQYGQNGVTNRTFDTTSTMANWATNTGLAEQRFVGLTSGAAAQFETIRSQGLTGNFTFDLDTSVTQWNGGTAIAGQPNGQMFVTYTAFISNGMSQQPYEILNVGGSSFSVSITSALASNATLKVTQAIRYEWVSQTYNRSVTVVNDTYYGTTPVPAPGAVALLGLAGLGGRRRRRC